MSDLTPPLNLPVAKEEEKSSSAIPPVSSVPPAAIPNLKFKVRTMGTDLQSLKEGKLPAGQEVEIAPSPSSAELKKTLSPLLPASSSKEADFVLEKGKLGGRITLFSRFKKILGLDTKKKEKEVKITPPPIVVSPPLPVSVSPPVPPPPLKQAPVLPLPSKNQDIKVPPVKRFDIFSSKITWAIITIVVLAVGGFWLFSGSTKPTIEKTPESSPSAAFSPTPTPVSTAAERTSLIKIFNNYEPLVLSSAISSPGDLRKEAIAILLRYSQKNILLDPKDEQGEDFSFTAFLDRFLISFPANLASYVDNQNFFLILTKQNETFADGNFSTSPDPTNWRLGLIVRVVDNQKVRSLLFDWETSLVEDFSNFYGLPITAMTAQDNIYRDTPLRFWNFSYPDRSLDYAVLTAINNDDYLVLANSREQIFSIIDILLGF